MQSPCRVGLISDTHGLLRPAVHDAFRGVDMILHAGDVGDNLILAELDTIALVHAVLGNTDFPDRIALEDVVELELSGVRIHLSHGHELGSPTPAKLLEVYDADVIVYGHTHRQHLHRDGNRLVVNPGSAGARRFNLPASVAILAISGGNVEVVFQELPD
jgi:hypothetical protein